MNVLLAFALTFGTFAVALVAAIWVVWVRPAEERAELAEGDLARARRGLTSATQRVLELTKTHPNERPTLAP